MSIPRVFHPVYPQDFVQRPFKVYKRYFLDGSTLTDSSSGYRIWQAVHTKLKTPVGSTKANNDPTNSFDGTFQHIIWNQLDAQYYRFGSDSTKTLEHSNSRYSYKFLNYSASAVSLPYLDYGESIKPGSVEVTQSTHNFNLTDDSNGNLYDIQINTGSFPDRHNLVGYWGFNDEFRKFKYVDGKIERGTCNYQSNVFGVDRPSYIKNVRFETGVEINNTPSGMCANFIESGSYILTEHKDEFNFGKNDNFSISFWLNAPNTSSNFNIISKNKIIEKLTYGDQIKYQNDLAVNSLHVSRSFIEEETPIYPFHISFENGSVIFSRSDGITAVELYSNPVTASNYTHFCFVKTGSQLQVYQDGNLTTTSNDLKENCYNKHALTFGYNETSNFKLDEIRIYNVGLSSENIATLCNNNNQSLYQTAVCGNVFYRRGNIVISGFDPKYQNVFKDGWYLKYRGTHTIYQTELVTRINPGDFNLSQNPTTLKSYKEDLIIDDMTTGSLFPYVTEIGFYDDAGNLLIVGKLNQPLQMRDDVTINIITKFHV